MADEFVQIENLCCDLIANRKYDGFVAALLASAKGQWCRVRDLLPSNGMAIREYDILPDEVFVVWLDDAVTSPDFVSIIFHGYGTLWTMCAHFNRRALPR